jgi:menaquinone-dependent protoporphyrinogen oxidase
VLSVGEIDDVTTYDAVVIGSALYMGRWLREARRFVRRNADALRRVPVWMFSSGPLDDSAKHRELLPTGSVRSLMTLAGARGHATFGGCLSADARGFPAAQIAKHHAGDWRDLDQVAAWARTIAADLSSPMVDHKSPPKAALAILCLFVGLTALAGGASLIARPDGSILHLSTTTLAHAPFDNFLIPGVLLFGLGLVNTGAGAGALALWRGPRPLASLAGGALFVWIVAQMIMLRTINPLQLAFLTIAIAILGLAQGVTMIRPSTSPRFKRA